MAYETRGANAQKALFGGGGGEEREEMGDPPNIILFCTEEERKFGSSRCVCKECLHGRTRIVLFFFPLPPPPFSRGHLANQCQSERANIGPKEG